MKISDLKTGMKLEAQNGEKLIVGHLTFNVLHPETLEPTEYELICHNIENFTAFAKGVGLKIVKEWSKDGLKGDKNEVQVQ